ncbi:MAG: gamma carbonic anhydrase family protein [Planktomarina sp.]
MIYALDGIAPELPETDDYWIAPGAHVIGNVRIGAQTSIWFGATLRGDMEHIALGDGSNVQENAVLHTDEGFPLVIGENCTIGHSAIVHGCRIGDQTLIGMGATVLNGAQIGKNCLIGANALVTEGKVIPDGSLVIGAPAKVVRELTVDEIAKLHLSALSYQRHMRQFKNGLTPLE